jgi:hypothetical protein
MAVNSAISALPTTCLPGPGAGAWRSALDITDHVCSLGQLRLLLRRSRGFCGHRPTTALMNVATVTAKLE